MAAILQATFNFFYKTICILFKLQTTMVYTLIATPVSMSELKIITPFSLSRARYEVSIVNIWRKSTVLQRDSILLIKGLTHGKFTVSESPNDV